MFQNFDNLSFQFMSFTLGAKRNFYLVIVHGMRRVSFGNEDGFSSIFGDETVLAVAFSLESTNQYLSLIVQFIMSFFCFYKETVF